MSFTRITLSLILTFSLVSTVASKGQAQSSIHGRVVGPFGTTLTSIHVELAGGDKKSHRSTRTDEQGNYMLDQLPEGPYVIVFSGVGFITERKDINLSRGNIVKLDVGLISGTIGNDLSTELSGMVRQSDTKPLGDATVIVKHAYNECLSFSARTDKSGRYRISVRYPGQYIGYASKPGFAVSVMPLLFSTDLPRPKLKADFTLSQLNQP